MAIKDIVVHLDNTPSCIHRVELAMALAQRHQAHLQGLFARTNPDLLAMSGARDAQIRDASRESKQRFFDMAKQYGVDVDWLDVDVRGDANNVIREVLRFARQNDLVIVGQHDEDNADGSLPDDLPDRVVLAAGRPVIVVPHSWRLKTTFERALVAWNASQEAVRAVNDAIPLLQEASRVQVLSVATDASKGSMLLISGEDICQHLIRHNVNAVAISDATADIEIGELLLSRAAEESIDLLVMGAYGRARIIELVLGGATRELLQQMTVPILMSR